MTNLFDELRDKIDSTDTEKLTEIQEKLTQAKNNGDITDDEFHRLKEHIGQRLGGFNL